MYFKVRLADLVIGVECLYETTRMFCKDYVSEDMPIDFEVKITDEDIRNEWKMSDDTERKKENNENVQILDSEIWKDENHYRNKYLETLALLRKIAKYLPEYDCFLMHGAVVSANDYGYMFTAPSGTGKSTHINLWKQYFDGIEIINGDKPFIRVMKDKVWAYGTPWCGKEGWQKNASVPLKGICLLNRGRENHIAQITPVQVLPFIMRQVHYMDDSEMAGKTLELLNRLMTEVKLYRLECDVSREAAKCSYEGMVGNV